MAQLIQQGRAPAEMMAKIAADDARLGPYRPCPCGSGEKFRFCHGTRVARKERVAPAPIDAGRTIELDMTND